MSYGSRGGRPYVCRFSVKPGGTRYMLPVRSAELVIRPQTGTARLYWQERDYLADPQGDSPTADGYCLLNRDQYAGELRLRASVDTLWLRGDAELEVIIISQG